MLMNSAVATQSFHVVPPRKGKVIALAVDATAREYDMRSLQLDGWAPGEGATSKTVFVTLQAITADAWIYFASAHAASQVLDSTSKISAGSALAYADTYGWRIKADSEQRFCLHRALDQYLVVQGSTTGILLLRASSETV